RRTANPSPRRVRIEPLDFGIRRPDKRSPESIANSRTAHWAFYRGLQRPRYFAQPAIRREAMIFRCSMGRLSAPDAPIATSTLSLWLRTGLRSPRLTPLAT